MFQVLQTRMQWLPAWSLVKHEPYRQGDSPLGKSYVMFEYSKYGKKRYRAVPFLRAFSPYTRPLRWTQTGYRAAWVYACQESDAPLVKIGHSANPKQRRYVIASEWQTSVSLVAATFVPSFAVKVEYSIHGLLASQWIEYEWYYTPMCQYILDGLVVQAAKYVLQDIDDCLNAYYGQGRMPVPDQLQTAVTLLRDYVGSCHDVATGTA
jgi:hypothetical protein